MAKIDLMNLKNVQGMSRDQIKEIQRALIDSGYLDRTFQSKFGERASDDGIWGNKSQAALDAYLNANSPKDFSGGAGFIWNPAAGYDYSSEFFSKPSENKPSENKTVYNPYPGGASTGISGFIEESIAGSKENRANRNFDLSNFDKNNPESVINTQQWLIKNGYLTEDDARGGWGPKSQAAYDRATSLEQPLDFEEYMYRSGSVGLGRRLGNLWSVTRNMINGYVNPHGNNAGLSEGGRRQLVGGSINEDGSVTDKSHTQFGASEESGKEFRTQSGFLDMIKQAMDAPYHNVYGQTAVTTTDGGKTYFVGANPNNPDAYTFNNQWRGDKVIKVYEDREGTGSFWDAIKEFKAARDSGAAFKAAIESGAAVRGTDVQAGKKNNQITEEDMTKYHQEYQNYVNMDPEKRYKINLKLLGIKN